MPTSRHGKRPRPQPARTFQQVQQIRKLTNEQLLELNQKILLELDHVKSLYNDIAVRHNALVGLLVMRNHRKPINVMIEEFTRIGPGVGVVTPNVNMGFWTFEWDPTKKLPLMETRDARSRRQALEEQDGEREQPQEEEHPDGAAARPDVEPEPPERDDRDIDDELDRARRDLGLPTRRA
jgi:hypothetical protein